MILGKRNFRFFFVVGFIFFILSILSIFSFFSIYLLLFGDTKETEIKNDLFHLSHLNPSSNETKYGFVRIGRSLSNEEYISYNNPSGDTSVISNFFDSEYECTGSCFCEIENFRRTSSSLINHGMFIILSAFSVSMAFSIAEETFSNKCENTLHGVCEKKNVKSEVEDCKKNRFYDRGSRDPHEVEVKDGEEKDGKMKRSYICSGHCFRNKQHNFHSDTIVDKLRDGSPDLQRAREEFGDCTKLETTGEVEVIVPYNTKRIVNSNKYAKAVFYKQYLVNFCRKTSLVKVTVKKNSLDYDNYHYVNDKKEKYTYYLKEIETPACVGYCDLPNRFANVKCRLTSKLIL